MRQTFRRLVPIRRPTLTLVIVLLAGAVTACGGNGGQAREQASSTPSTAARESPPDLDILDLHGIAVTPDGTVFVADTAGSRVLRIDSNGTITNFAGKPGFAGFEGDGGPAAEARLSGPTGLAADSAGNLYIVDHTNGRIRKVDPQGTITTVAGGGQPDVDKYPGDGGPATEAGLQEPIGVAVGDSGRLYIADRDNYRVRAVDTDGTISTLAGSGSLAGDGDGPSGDGADAPTREGTLATSADLGLPVGVAAGARGTVFVSDETKHTVYKIDAHGVMTPFAGTGKAGYNGDGGPATDATLKAPYLLASDGHSSVYIVDAESHVIRVTDRKGNIRTVAGTGKPGFSGDDGPATRARLNEPYGVAVDRSGAIYISDHGNSRIRRVEPSGTITTILP